jgi:hypothetical protein
MRAQSSGLGVFGRSSFSLNSSTHAVSRWAMRIPFCPVSRSSLTLGIFLARDTMFSIIAPELKSLKYRTSLSPLADELLGVLLEHLIDLVENRRTAE